MEQIQQFLTGLSDRQIVLIAFGGYMCVLLAVGAVAMRRRETMEGYFLGNRRSGPLVTAISSVASSESAWLVLGFVGEAYLLGFSAAWVAVGCLLGFLFNWYVLAPRLRRHTGLLGAVTLPDFLEARTGDPSSIIRIPAVLIIFLLMFTYVAAQFTAAGKTFEAAFGVDYRIGVSIGASVTVLYTLAGGYRAVAWTDVIQGLLMVVALVVLPVMAIIEIGGPAQLMARLRVEEARQYAALRVAGPEGLQAIALAPGETLYFNVAADSSVVAEKVEGQTVAARIRMPDGDADAPVVLAGRVLSESGIPVFPSLNGRSMRLLEAKLQKGDTIAVGPAANRWRQISGAAADASPPAPVRAEFENYHSLNGGEDLLSTFGKHGNASQGIGLAFLGFLIGMLGIGLGYPGAPHVLTRYMAARDERALRRGRVIAIIWGVFALYGAVLLGVSLRALPGVTEGMVDPEHGLLRAGQAFLHPAIFGIVVAAVIAALHSTADSQLLVAASAITRDLYEKTLGIQPDPGRVARIARWSVLLLGVAAMGLALVKVRVVFWFVLFSWAGLGASFGPVVILSLYWRGLTRWGALGGMLTGFGMTLAWRLTLSQQMDAWLTAHGFQALGLYEIVPAFFASFLAAYLLSLVTRRPSDVDDQFEEVRSSAL